MSEILEVQITPEDFKESSGYISPWRCPLAIALQRMFPNKHICVGPSTVDIEDGQATLFYKINMQEWGATISPMNTVEIDRLIRAAKKDLEGIPTVSLTLELSQ